MARRQAVTRVSSVVGIDDLLDAGDLAEAPEP
jgi:hypothetical protein